jgi:hypothetical protein
MTKLQLAIALAVRSRNRVTCAAVAELATEHLGYEPSPTHVSRILAEWGWEKGTVDGKVGFTRTVAEDPA